MSDHLSKQILDRYRRQRLEASELLVLDDHVASCAACRERLREVKSGRTALEALRASLQATSQTTPEHLPYEQLVGYAKGQLDEVDRELAESHLEFCEHCLTQARGLSDSVRQGTNRQGASPVAALTHISLSSVRTMVRSWLGPFSRQERIWVYGFTVALSVFLVTAAAVYVYKHRDTQETSSSISQPTPIPLPEQHPPAPAPILVAINDGNIQITLDTLGNFTGLEALSPDEQQHVKTTLRTQRVPTPKTLGKLSNSSSPLMGSLTGSDFRLLSPIGKIVITNRPTFHWKSLAGTISYQVTITDPEANYKEVGTSPELKVTRWTMNNPLKRGRIYNWQVIARTQNGEVKAPASNQVEARFKVLEQAIVVELARAKRVYTGRHLVLGILYAQAGLLQEAEHEFEALVSANPRSPIAKKLLSDVRAKIR